MAHVPPFIVRVAKVGILSVSKVPAKGNRVVGHFQETDRMVGTTGRI